MKLTTLLTTGLVALTGIVGGAVEAQALEYCRNIYRQASPETRCLWDNGTRGRVHYYVDTLGDQNWMSDNTPSLSRAQIEVLNDLIKAKDGPSSSSFIQESNSNPFQAQHEIVDYEFDGTRYQCKNSMGHTVSFQYSPCF